MSPSHLRLRKGLLTVAVGFLSHGWITLSSHAQVVQLPSFRNFSVSGGAWVPDSGSASLGGTGYATSGGSARGWGPYGPRAAGGARGGSTASMSAYIIDLQALDQALLSTADPVPPGPLPPSPLPPSTLTSTAPKPLGYTNFDVPPPKNLPLSDPSEWQRVLAGVGLEAPVAPSIAEANVLYFLQRAKDAERDNHIQSARVYYRMAAEAMPPEMIIRYRRALQQQAEKEEAQRKAAAADPKRKSF